MPAEAAREGRLPTLAAVRVSASAGEPAVEVVEWRETASRRFSWSAQTSTWADSDLWPESWWRARNYYRARWYSSEAGAFIERDPMGHHDSPSSYAPLAFNGVGYLDPSGMSPLGHPYNWFTGVQAHQHFTAWFPATIWYKDRVPDVYLNKSLGRAVTEKMEEQPLKYFEYLKVAINQLSRPDVLYLPERASSVGEILDLKPVTYRENKAAAAEARIWQAAQIAYMKAHGRNVIRGVFGPDDPRAYAGIVLPAAGVLDTDDAVYQVKIIAAAADEAPGFVFYELVGAHRKKVRQGAMASVPSWAKVLAPRLRRVEVGMATAKEAAEVVAIAGMLSAIALGQLVVEVPASIMLPFVPSCLQNPGTPCGPGGGVPSA